MAAKMVKPMNHNYLFGTSFAESTNGTIQKYKYNGKELDTTNNLNLYDYGARSYDSVLGIWTIQDPLVEKYYPISPYVYCGNNPINRVDPDGCDWYQFENKNSTKLTVWQEENAKTVTINDQVIITLEQLHIITSCYWSCYPKWRSRLRRIANTINIFTHAYTFRFYF